MRGVVVLLVLGACTDVSILPGTVGVGVDPGPQFFGCPSVSPILVELSAEQPQATVVLTESCDFEPREIEITLDDPDGAFSIDYDLRDGMLIPPEPVSIVVTAVDDGQSHEGQLNATLFGFDGEPVATVSSQLFSAP